MMQNAKPHNDEYPQGTNSNPREGGHTTAGILYMERVFVGNLDSEITEQQLINLFHTFGPCDVKIIRDKGGVSKGYGFVTFTDVQIVEKLVAQRTIKLNNRTLNIGLAIRRIKHDQTPPPTVPAYPNYNNFYMPPMQYVASPMPLTTPTVGGPIQWPYILPTHLGQF